MKLGMVGLNTKIAGVAIVAIPVLISFVLVGDEAVSPSDTLNQITVVKADPKPIKRRPEAPGGMEIPFQDFEIWSILEGGR
jgi:hypothetical protein